MSFSLLLYLFLINPAIPEVRSNVCPENFIAKVYPVDILKVSSTDFRSLSVKRDIPVTPFAKKPFANNTDSPAPSDQCYFFKGHRSIADRGPESALLVFSGIYLGYPLNTISLIPRLPFVIFTSWNGNCIKIRPPPKA